MLKNKKENNFLKCFEVLKYYGQNILYMSQHYCEQSRNAQDDMKYFII